MAENRRKVSNPMSKCWNRYKFVHFLKSNCESWKKATPLPDVDDESFDPYQVFEVKRVPCIILTVRVVRARNVTNGLLQDIVDTPDPYVKLYMRTSPEGSQQTKVKTNCVNPEWDESFTFYLNFNQANILKITLMESNTPELFPGEFLDGVIGTAHFDIAHIRKMDTVQRETIIFQEVMELDIDFTLNWDANPSLRYSLCLSDAEKQFRARRQQQMLGSMREWLGGKDAPTSEDEVPNIAIIGSGGGFRALTGYSGVFKALMESGVLGCTMYAGGLSGSSWLLSTLYSHPKWPNIDMTEFLDELMNSVDKSLLRFLNPLNVTHLRYVTEIIAKRRDGQPVTFTDFFGKMVGETLLKGRMDVTLTDQRQKLEDGGCPMPLYTCVHVKKDKSAMSFQEWVEFSPYEIGLPKYGTFMDTELFGSKFFMGKLVKKYKEQPLHFLQGIWGSAFCILFKRILDDKRNVDPIGMLRREENENASEMLSQMLEKSGIRDETPGDFDKEKTRAEMFSYDHDSSSDCSDEIQDSDENDDDGVILKGEKEAVVSELNTYSIRSKMSPEKGKDNKNDAASEHVAGDPAHYEERKEQNRSNRKRTDVNSQQVVEQNTSFKHSAQKEKQKAFRRKSKSGSFTFWEKLAKKAFESKSWELFSSRRYRAAVIHSFLRGLSLQQTYPLSPFTPHNQRVKEGDNFDCIFDMTPTSLKHMHMVDAGLTFNSPYPLVLRPQREVDIILSFDFSGRPSDRREAVFKELLLAEEWAKINKIKFPPIDLSNFDSRDVKELYVFKDPKDPYCPVVFHFPLVNNKFKCYSKPGVERKSKEEFDFSNFQLFDDAGTYSTFCFNYAHENFKKLSQLTEFNTLLHIDDIKQEVKAAVRKKREHPKRKEKQKLLLRINKDKIRKRSSIRKKISDASDSECDASFHTAEVQLNNSTASPFFSGMKDKDITLPQGNIDSVDSCQNSSAQTEDDSSRRRKQGITEVNLRLNTLLNMNDSCSSTGDSSTMSTCQARERKRKETPSSPFFVNFNKSSPLSPVSQILSSETQTVRVVTRKQSFPLLDSSVDVPHNPIDNFQFSDEQSDVTLGSEIRAEELSRLLSSTSKRSSGYSSLGGSLDHTEDETLDMDNEEAERHREKVRGGKESFRRQSTQYKTIDEDGEVDVTH